MIAYSIDKQMGDRYNEVDCSGFIISYEELEQQGFALRHVLKDTLLSYLWGIEILAYTECVFLSVYPTYEELEHTVCRAGQAGIGSCAIRRKTKKPEQMLRLKICPSQGCFMILVLIGRMKRGSWRFIYRLSLDILNPHR